MIRIATWNLNSIRARKERLLAWLDKNQPDALCLQETKVVDELFPEQELREAGYFSAFHGQKTYNGVAILSKEEPQEILRSFGDGEDDSQARFIGATIGGIRIYSGYIPNGSSLGSEKYAYKLKWLSRLSTFLDKHEEPGRPIALCGDWNIAPEDRDIHDPALWEGEVLCTDAERAALAKIVDWGFTDSFRLHNQEEGKFSWWDYRMLGFPKNKGLRIDHIYLTDSLKERCIDSQIDRDERKGKGASDHAPVIADLSAE